MYPRPLSQNETYICNPHLGCPITPLNSYWQLLKTLYGLKRSPCHLHEMSKKILLRSALVYEKSLLHLPANYYCTDITL